jgi:hypothetical protein
VTARAGYAKVAGDVVPDGMIGLGFGYRRLVLDNWSVGAFAHYDVLGRFDQAGLDALGEKALAELPVI